METDFLSQRDRSPFHVSEATLAEMDILAPLFDAYRQIYRQPSDVAAARAFLERRLARRESVVFLACRNEPGAREGLGFAQLYPGFSSVVLGSIWVLNDLYVAPPFRRQGVASRLLEEIRQFALKTRARRVALNTGAGNHAAQLLYEKRGWIRNAEFCAYSLELHDLEISPP